MLFQKDEGMGMPGAFRLDQRFRYRTRKDTCVTPRVLDLKTARLYLGKVTGSKAIRGMDFLNGR